MKEFLDLSPILECLQRSIFYPAMSDAQVTALIARGFIEQAIKHEQGDPNGVGEKELSERVSRLVAARDLCPSLEQIEQGHLVAAATELARQRLLLVAFQ